MNHSHIKNDAIFDELPLEKRRCSSCRKKFIVNFSNNDYYGNVMCDFVGCELLTYYICEKCESTHDKRLLARMNAIEDHESKEHGSVNFV